MLTDPKGAGGELGTSDSGSPVHVRIQGRGIAGKRSPLQIRSHPRETDAERRQGGIVRAGAAAWKSALHHPTSAAAAAPGADWS